MAGDNDPTLNQLHQEVGRVAGLQEGMQEQIRDHSDFTRDELSEHRKLLKGIEKRLDTLDVNAAKAGGVTGGIAGGFFAGGVALIKQLFESQ